MKNILLLLAFTLLATACSKGGKTTASFAVTIAGISAPTGGMMVTGKSASGEAFSRLMTQDSLGLDLNNGVWNFLVVSWDGATAFTGKIRCSTRRDVSLEGKEVNLQFVLTNSHCSETGVAEVGHWDAGATPADFQGVNFSPCRSGWAGLTTASTCNFESTNKDSPRAPIASVRVFVASSDVNEKGQYVQLVGGRLGDPTACYETNSALPLRIPVFVSDFYFPLTIRGFAKPACNGFTLDALAQTDTLKFFDNSTVTKIFAHFSDDVICAEAKRVGVTALSDIGRGTTAHPYGICTLAQLYDWQRNYGTGTNYKSADVYLLNDLNLLSGVRVRNSTVTPNAFSQCIDDGSTFAPIGIAVPAAATCSYTPDATAYTGIFHGLGHTLSQFRFRPLKPFVVNDVGLFRSLQGSIVHLNLDGGQVSGDSNVGMLAGTLTGAIRDVKIQGVQIEGETSNAGSVAGYATGALERVQVKEASVRGGDDIGGLVGTGANLTEVSFHGLVTSQEDSSSTNVGGLAGNIVNIDRGVSAGLVRGNTQVGGIAGSSSGNIIYTRSTMAIVSNQVSTPVDIGGLVGNATTGTIQHSIFAGSISTPCTGTPCMVGEIRGTGSATFPETWSPGIISSLGGQNGTTTAGGDTTLVYGKNDVGICPADDCTLPATQWLTTGTGMPRLAFEDTVCDEANNLLSVSDQQTILLRGTSDKPIIICTYNQFLNLNSETGYARLEQDIYMHGPSMVASNFVLAANLDGNGHFIYGARYSSSSFNLFQSISANTTIQDLNIADFAVGNNLTDETSALVKNNYGTIRDLQVYDIVLKGVEKISGLAVYNHSGAKILTTSLEGSIRGENNLGGIAYSNAGEISQVQSSMSIAVPAGHTIDITLPIGGIVAVNSNTIKRSEFSGKINVLGDGLIEATGGVGGIAGANNGTIEDVLVSDEANILVTIDQDNVIGGLVGINGNSLTRGVNLGTIYNLAVAASGVTTNTVVGDETGTTTSVFAERAAQNFFGGSNLSAPSDNGANCSGGSSLSVGANYTIRFSSNDREFFRATATGSVLTYFKDTQDSCYSGTLTAYTPFATDTFTPVTLIGVASPLGLTNFATDDGASTIKTAYVNYLTSGALSSLVWTWDEGKPQLFNVNNK